MYKNLLFELDFLFISLFVQFEFLIEDRELN